MIYAGVALLVAAAVLYAFAQRNAGKARRIIGENLTPAELLALHRQVVGDADVAGAFSQTVDSSGLVRCESPLTAPMSSTLCVYYRATVTAQIEERQTTTDAQGRSSERWVRDDRIVSESEHGTTFQLCGADASVAVSATGAKLDRPVETVDRLESHMDGSGAGLSIGGLTLDFGSFGSRQRLLGYRHEECVVPLEAHVFVHGSVDDAGGRLTFRAADGSPLLISTRSEEQIVAGAEQAARWQRIAAICGAVGGVALTVAALAGV